VDEKPPIEPVLRSLAAKARRDLDDHPTPEELVAYRAGELTAEDEERIRDHLALCRDCSQLLLDLKQFEEGSPEDAGDLSDVQVEAAWRRLRPRLEERKVLTSRRWFASPRIAYGLAAGLFLCTVGLSVWGFSLQRKIEHLSEPQVNVRYVDLYTPDEAKRGAGSQDIDNIVPSGGSRFLLLIHAWNIPALPEYRVVIRRTGTRGEALLRKNGLTRDEEGILSLELHRQRVPPGRYDLELYAGGKSGPPVATYLFDVAPP
jgi:Putative zinc-finger